MNDPLVKISQVSKTFPGDSRSAIDHISTEIPKGKIVGLVGPIWRRKH